MLAIAAAYTFLTSSAALSSLPTPLPMPNGIGIDPADVLAQKVAEHQADAGSALIAALQASGFTIIGRGKQVIVAPVKGKGCGIALDENEVLSMVNARKDGPGVHFKTVSDTLSVLLGQDKLQTIHANIVDGWRDALKRQVPEMAFLARFLDDLSVHGEGHWSIWGPASIQGQNIQGPGSSYFSNSPLSTMKGVSGRFDAIQAYSNSMMAELTPKLSDPKLSVQDRLSVIQAMEPIQTLQGQVVEASALGQLASQDPSDVRIYKDNPISMIQLVLLNRRIYGDVYAAMKKKHEATLYVSTNPVGFDDRDYSGTIMDADAAYASSVFNQFVTTTENIGKNGVMGMDVANTVGAWSKIVSSFLNLEITVEPSPVELQRRKDKTPSASQVLTTTVKINMPYNPDSDLAKSARAISWGLGADLSVPDHGAVAGAEVNWHINEPGDVLDRAAQFVSPGNAGDGQVKSTNQTDNDGKCTIGVQASGQRVVKPENSIPFDRKMMVEVEVKLKGANIYQDTVDAFAAVAGVATSNSGDLPALLKTTLPDMLNRTSLFSTKTFRMKVHDWTTPLYEGTFTLQIKGHADSHLPGDTESWDIDRSAKGKIYSIYRGTTLKDNLSSEGRGAYYFQIEDLHDVNIKDSLTHQFPPPDACADKKVMWNESLKINGPVVRMGSPYELQAGSFMLQSEHKNGASGVDKLRINGSLKWSLPCKYVRTLTNSPGDSGIQYMDMPIEFTDTMPPHPQSLNGTGLQTQDVILAGLKGKIRAELKWELHRVNPSAGK